MCFKVSFFGLCRCHITVSADTRLSPSTTKSKQKLLGRRGPAGIQSIKASRERRRTRKGVDAIDRTRASRFWVVSPEGDVLDWPPKLGHNGAALLLGHEEKDDKMLTELAALLISDVLEDLRVVSTAFEWQMTFVRQMGPGAARV